MPRKWIAASGSPVMRCVRIPHGSHHRGADGGYPHNACASARVYVEVTPLVATAMSTVVAPISGGNPARATESAVTV